MKIKEFIKQETKNNRNLNQKYAEYNIKVSLNGKILIMGVIKKYISCLLIIFLISRFAELNINNSLLIYKYIFILCKIFLFYFLFGSFY